MKLPIKYLKILGVSLCLFFLNYSEASLQSQPIQKTGSAVLPKPIQLILNWKAEPEFGGFYAAQIQGIFARHGLNVKLIEGGAAVPTIQMVAASQMEFGISSAEEVLVSRARGTDVVALFATFQDSPMIFMTHTEKGFRSIQELFRADGILAARQGYPFFLYLTRQFGAPRPKIVPYFGGIDHFLANPNYSQQAFATSEPLLAAEKGVKVQSFLISQAGYNSYQTVLIAKKSYLDTHLELAKKLVLAVREGWAEYNAQPQKINQYMHQLNPTISLSILNQAASAQKVFILPKNSPQYGHMTQEKWQKLADQLFTLKVLPKKMDVRPIFLNL